MDDPTAPEPPDPDERGASPRGNGNRRSDGTPESGKSDFDPPSWTAPDDADGLDELTERLANESVGEFTQLIREDLEGNRDRLLRMVSAQLRWLARKKKVSFPGDSIQATELIDAAYLRLMERGHMDWKSRRHFLWLAGRAMHDVCIARLRRRMAQRRGGGERPVPLDSTCELSGKSEEEVLMLSEAVSRLSKVDKWAGSIVELRFFVGLTGDEIADQLGVSPSTVDRRWVFGKAWLHRELS